MTEIKINQYGKIIKGDKKGWVIFIKDDQTNSGGYLILISSHKNSDVGFDAWVLNYNDLKQYFIESNWDVKWE
jgi:hypothetical protein